MVVSMIDATRDRRIRGVESPPLRCPYCVDGEEFKRMQPEMGCRAGTCVKTVAISQWRCNRIFAALARNAQN